MKLICLGDSTMQLNDESTYPQVGWPQALMGKLNGVEIIDLAKNGRSTKSYIDEGLFEDAKRYIDEDSVVLIEFGHNDEHKHQPERFTRPDHEYRDNLIYMYKTCKDKGARVIFLTPICRRHFKADGSVDESSHDGYRQAMIKVAEDMGTDCIDMTGLTKQRLEQIGEADSRELFMNFDAGIYDNYPEGSDDNTHLRWKGAQMVAELFLEEIKKDSMFEGRINV